MSASALLEHLKGIGVELWADGGRLRYRARDGALTAELRAQLADNKQQLLALLRDAEHHQANGEYAAPAAPREHPYARFVNPHVAALLSRVNLDKDYVRGEGCRLYDSDGNEYTDCTAQYGALPFGYNPPFIWDALVAARDAGLASFAQPSLLGPAGELARRLINVAPDGIRYAAFTNSGAESIEVAIKLARAATGRAGILATTDGFHGKTLGAVSATGRAVFQVDFGAPVPHFEHIPFGDAAALEAVLSERPGAFAAFIVEPIQGEGGIVEPPAGYLDAVRAVCSRFGVLLVFDEIQTGLGRTGALFACNHDSVSPDIIALAKALGGGLLPIGAVLYNEAAYSEAFARRHSSTFAGNALACQAGIATLDALLRDDRAVIRQTAETGAYLKQGLEQLRGEFPALVRAIRGRGLLLGLPLNLGHDSLQWGMFGYLAEQEYLSFLLTSYLLNVERMRVAPTVSAGDVIRIEPPLTFERADCDRLVEALGRMLATMQDGNTARLLGHLVGRNDVPARRFERKQEIGGPRNDMAGANRFAFLVHLMDIADAVQFDPSLKAFRRDELTRIKSRFNDLLAPSVASAFTVHSPAGASAHGEFIIVPYTAQELATMPHADAVAELRKALALAHEHGAQLAGLGGFTSIASQGGADLAGNGFIPVTTGNTYTAAVACQAIEKACTEAGRPLGETTIAVVGATGAIGRLIALWLARRCGRLQLIGRPQPSPRGLARLRAVAAEVLAQTWKETGQGKGARCGPLAGWLRQQLNGQSAPSDAAGFEALLPAAGDPQAPLAAATSLESALHGAQVVVTATAATEAFIEPGMLGHGSIVYEVSRPFNVSRKVETTRPDVRVIKGGVVRLPGQPGITFDLGLEQGEVYACIAETILLALAGQFSDASIGVELDAAGMAAIEELAALHGFSVVS